MNTEEKRVLFAMMYFTIFLIICSSCFVNGNFHSRFTSEEKTIFEFGSQLASLGMKNNLFIGMMLLAISSFNFDVLLWFWFWSIFIGSPEIKIKRLDSNLLNIYVGWDIFIGKDRSYLQLNVDEYGNLASTLDFNVYDIKGNFKLNPIDGRPSKCFNVLYKSCKPIFFKISTIFPPMYSYVLFLKVTSRS